MIEKCQRNDLIDVQTEQFQDLNKFASEAQYFSLIFSSK